MKAYPLIYSRTKNFDFVPDFLARPKDLNCQLALKYVKNAVNNLDFVQGIRYMAFPVERYCICGGIACISAKLVDKLKLLLPEFAMKYPDASEYLKDCKGRSLACFIGIAIPKSEIRNGMIPDISLEKYWEVYLQYLKNQWFSEINTSSEQLDFPTIEIKEKKYVESFLPQKEMFGSHSVIKNYASHEQQTLDYFFHTIFSGKDDSFITEIQNREEWDALIFKTAAVSETLYSALKASPVNLSGSKSSLLGSNSFQKPNTGGVKINKMPDLEFEANSSQKKTPHPSITPIIVVAIIVVIALVIFRKIL